jgi:hypothetical protein
MKVVTVVDGVVELAGKIVDRSGPEMLAVVLLEVVLILIASAALVWLLRQRRP